MTYGVHDYGRMLADRVRMRAYADALAAVVKPGAVVLDLGTGVGVHAILACKLGARRVFAVEPNAAIEVGERIARDNGFSDRITFIRALSTEIDLPGPVDVIVSDLRGVLPLYGAHLESLADAKQRFLAPGGVLLPARDELYAAVVEAPEPFDRVVGPYRGGAGSVARELGVDLSGGVETVAGGIYPDIPPLEPEHLLTRPARWATIRYGEPSEGLVSGSCAGAFTRAGTAHGLSLWFDAEILETPEGGVRYSNAPGSELVYGRAFAPFPEPVAVAEGGRFEVALFARRVADDYLWGWTTTVTDASGGRRSFRQTNAWQVAAWPRPQDPTARAARGALAARAAVELGRGAPAEEVVAHLTAPNAALSAQDARRLVGALAGWLGTPGGRGQP